MNNRHSFPRPEHLWGQAQPFFNGSTEMHPGAKSGRNAEPNSHLPLVSRLRIAGVSHSRLRELALGAAYFGGGHWGGYEVSSRLQTTYPDSARYVTYDPIQCFALLT
jgi:hypothetical protein